jgi:hypothetical protein
VVQPLGASPGPDAFFPPDADTAWGAGNYS